MGREIVTKSARFYCVSLQPDICKTPIGPSTRPVPYTVKGEFVDATGVSPDIRSNDEPVVIHASTVIPTVTGDEPGTAKGVKSGTVSKRVQHDQRSATVRFNGERAIRVGDQVFMNDKNTVGQVYERAGSASLASAGTSRQPATPRSGSHAVMPGGDAVKSFSARFQNLLVLAGSVEPRIAALARAPGQSPVSLLAQALGTNPGAASAGDDGAAGNAQRGLLAMALQSSGANQATLQNLLSKAPGFISSAILNRIPGVARIAAQAAAAPIAEQRRHVAPTTGPASATAASAPTAPAGVGDGGSSRGRYRPAATSRGLQGQTPA